MESQPVVKALPGQEYKVIDGERSLVIKQSQAHRPLAGNGDDGLIGLGGINHGGRIGTVVIVAGGGIELG
jgi:hypothetical protein